MKRTLWDEREAHLFAKQLEDEDYNNELKCEKMRIFFILLLLPPFSRNIINYFVFVLLNIAIAIHEISMM